jgi:hypothetical protein
MNTTMIGLLTLITNIAVTQAVLWKAHRHDSIPIEEFMREPTPWETWRNNLFTGAIPPTPLEYAEIAGNHDAVLTVGVCNGPWVGKTGASPPDGYPPLCLKDYKVAKELRELINGEYVLPAPLKDTGNPQTPLWTTDADRRFHRLVLDKGVIVLAPGVEAKTN